jgi:hypothetical protein
VTSIIVSAFDVTPSALLLTLSFEFDVDLAEGRYSYRS